ncbi:hypothetical protein [Sphingomonas immobilis]|uniref:Uncharacterized protein n=1 Tax=Sphingomonas immobilis TaxID=3063997 RepID=A0ABT9A3S0_9SPHN|nr:hypothetical protein [Sphingomonas sp. CA1-15]MDO7844485.1 hypothetical protein [Sphingomonas sp. CA1-15]
MSATRSTNESFLWPLALAATAILGTLVTACMMPFVGVAVASAATMPRGRAALTIGGVWAINQMLGFGLLGFPLDAFALSWGAALLLASLAAMLVAATLLGTRRDFGWRLFAGFVAAFVAYEAALFAFALVAGGAGTFTLSIIAQLAANDALWFAALIALHLGLTRAAPGWFGAGLALRSA